MYLILHFCTPTMLIFTYNLVNNTLEACFFLSFHLLKTVSRKGWTKIWWKFEDKSKKIKNISERTEKTSVDIHLYKLKVQDNVFLFIQKDKWTYLWTLYILWLSMFSNTNSGLFWITFVSDFKRRPKSALFNNGKSKRWIYLVLWFV